MFSILKNFTQALKGCYVKAFSITCCCILALAATYIGNIFGLLQLNNKAEPLLKSYCHD